MMSNLVVIGYEDPFKAEEVRLKLRRMQQDYLIDLEDAVAAVKDDKGKVKLHQAVNLTAAAVGGGFWVSRSIRIQAQVNSSSATISAELRWGSL